MDPEGDGDDTLRSREKSVSIIRADCEASMEAVKSITYCNLMTTGCYCYYYYYCYYCCYCYYCY